MNSTMIATEAIDRQLQTMRSLRDAPARMRKTRVPASYASTWSRTVERETKYVGNELAILQRASTFYWSDETMQAVSAAAPLFDLSKILCHRELLFCDFAFCWFQQPPFRIQMTTADADPIYALTWAYVLERKSQLPIVHFSVYTLRGGVPAPVTRASITLGRSFNEFDLPSDLDEATQGELERWQRQVGGVAQFLVSAWTFLRQKVATLESAHPARQARKRIAAAGFNNQPQVAIVHLRERDGDHRADGPDGSESGQRRYSCQWIVQAHTRLQWYPSLKTHLPILISPYIKGPEDRPLKPRDLPVFVVDR